MNPYINKAALKRHLLNRIVIVNPVAGKKFTRVASQAYDDLDIRISRTIDDYLRAQRIGKTITTP